MYEISENRNQNLSEYLNNKLNLQNKNTNLVEPKISENAKDAIESGRTSDSQQLGNGTLNKTLENLAQKSNPSKTEIMEADKRWAAKMLEMDLQTQNGAIWETATEKDPVTTHNHKMKEGNIPWEESYPVEQKEADQFPM